MTKLDVATLFGVALLLGGCANGLSLGGTLDRIGAQTDIRPAVTTAGNESKLYLSVVEGLTKQGRQAAALAFLDSYSQSGQEQTPRYWLLRGNALLALGRYDEAIVAFEQLQDTRLLSDGWNGKGRIAAAEQRWDEAEKDFTEAVAGCPANADFLNNLAFADLNLRKSDEAVNRLKQAHELDPDSDRIRTNLIIAWTLKGDGKRADAMFSDIKESGRRDAIRALVKSAVITLKAEKKS